MNSKTEQYRAVSDNETVQNDALTVRAMHNFASAINNFHHYTLNFKARGIICFPSTDYRSEIDTLSETVKLVMLLPKIPDGHDYLQWVIQHYKYADPGSNTITWKIYCSDYFYHGDDTLDTTYLGNYSSDSFTCSGSVGIANNVISVGHSLKIHRSSNGWSYITITSTTSAKTAQSALMSIDLMPYTS